MHVPVHLFLAGLHRDFVAKTADQNMQSLYVNFTHVLRFPEDFSKELIVLAAHRRMALLVKACGESMDFLIPMYEISTDGEIDDDTVCTIRVQVKNYEASLGDSLVQKCLDCLRTDRLQFSDLSEPFSIAILVLTNGGLTVESKFRRSPVQTKIDPRVLRSAPESTSNVHQLQFVLELRNDEHFTRLRGSMRDSLLSIAGYRSSPIRNYSLSLFNETSSLLRYTPANAGSLAWRPAVEATESDTMCSFKKRKRPADDGT
jgi:hypothetical protein